MVAINPEMLRELLDEFTEKEEVTREEMNAINQQIAELEKRIETSKVKLAGLNRDREKIDLMRERYLSGNWKLQLSNMASVNAESAAAATPTSAPAAPSSAPTAVSTPEPAAAPVSSPAPVPATSSHAEGRAARRAAREAASQPDSKATITNLEAVNAPVSATASAPVALPEPAPVVAEPEAPLPAPAPEPIVASEPEPAFAEQSATEAYDNVQSEPTFEPAIEEYSQAESIEHAPPDDPIMSSFNSAPAVAPDVASALASGAPVAEPAAAETDSGFSWSSTAINAVADQAPAAPVAQPNPWGSSGGAPVEAEQRQTPSDIWGHPAQPAQAPPAFAQPQAPAAESTGGWGYSEDQRSTAPNIPSVPTAMPSPAAPAMPAPSPTEGAWGQPASNPWGNPASAQPVDLPPAGGGWGQPTASRQGMPAMPAPTSFPVTPPAPAADNSANPGDAWGRGQASAGWASQGSPWGDPQAQAPAQANPFSQPQSQAPQAPAQMPAPAAEDESARSSLARAADGALISPVKGRRRGAGAPAAFDWGSPEGSPPANPSDPNQAGGSEDSGDNKKIDDVLKGLFK